MSATTPTLPQGYDPRADIQTVLRASRTGALATLGESGFPMATLVTVATDHDGTPILLTSQLSAHTKNLEADPRASLLLARTGKGDPLAHPRLTILGRAVRAGEAESARLKARFLARHPKAALYVDFADFGFWRLAVEAGHLNGGFAKAATLVPTQILTDLAGAQDLIAGEAGAVAHMNADHAEALALYATQLLGEPPGRWRATGVDPDGFDLAAGDRTARLPFETRVQDMGALRAALVAFAKAARAKQDISSG